MGKSANVVWEYATGNYNGGLYFRKRGDDGKIIDCIFVDRIFLARLIHEINECETYHLLISMGVGDVYLDLGKPSHRKPKRTVLRYLRKQFPDLLKGQYSLKEKIYLTHMISPYGFSACFMPRRKYRVCWPPKKKKVRKRNR